MDDEMVYFYKVDFSIRKTQIIHIYTVSSFLDLVEKKLLKHWDRKNKFHKIHFFSCRNRKNIVQNGIIISVLLIKAIFY